MNHSTQQGLSAIGWLVVLTVIAFFGLCAAKTVPVYVENYYVVNGLKALADQKGTQLKTMRKSEIEKELRNYFRINNVRSPEASQIEFDQTRRGLIVINKYEVRVPLMSNIDIVMSFHNELDTSSPEACCMPLESSISE